MNTEMVSLRTEFVKRVSRLPKPKNVAAALQPVFEALSNAIHSTQSKFPESVVKEGLVKVIFSMDRKKQQVQVPVEDNGIGLDQRNWEAFTTTDTDHKINAGGKGVGRLLWLDCFDSTTVNSIFEESGKLRKRSFDFVLSSDNQIQSLAVESVSNSDRTGFHVRFHGLRGNGYKEKFPAQGRSIFQHVTSHLLPVFIGDHCPRVIVSVNDETQEFLGAIDDIVRRQTSEEVEGGDEYGTGVSHSKGTHAIFGRRSRMQPGAVAGIRRHACESVMSFGNCPAGRRPFNGTLLTRRSVCPIESAPAPATSQGRAFDPCQMSESDMRGTVCGDVCTDGPVGDGGPQGPIYPVPY